MRMIKLLVALILTALIGIVAYAYLGDMEPVRNEVRSPVAGSGAAGGAAGGPGD